MSWHLIRIFWLSLFALVLPAQALACLEEQSATTNLSAPPSVVQTLNQQPTANEHKPVQSTPATQSHYAGSGLAILNAVRWNISERYSFSDGDPDVLDTVPPFYPIIDTSLVCVFSNARRQQPIRNFIRPTVFPVGKKRMPCMWH